MYILQEEMQIMLEVFYAGEQITSANYQELTDLLVSKNEA